jgi:pimeloyl-ACP methyl ester carboxylesterase
MRFVFAGRMDRLVPPEHVRDLWRHWDRPQTVWYDGSHMSFTWEPVVRRFVECALRTIAADDGSAAHRQPA